MLKYDRAKFIEDEKASFAVVAKTQAVVDERFKAGFSNIFFVGIGGTITSIWAIESFMKSRTTLDFHVELASELTTLGNKSFGPDSMMFISSASGDTKEIVEAVKWAQAKGAKVVGMIEKEGTPLYDLVDYNVGAPHGDTYYWYTVAARLMFLHGDFPEYDKFIEQMGKLAAPLADVQEAVDDKARDYCEKYAFADIHYFTGAGDLWGWTYCYSMCLMEEMLWMKTKSIHAAEFFHGTLEVIEKGIPVTIFQGEDAARPLTERCQSFFPKVTDMVTVFDTKDYELKGIDPAYRACFSPIVFHALCKRITTHFEDVRKHPIDIRRYYRRLEY